MKKKRRQLTIKVEDLDSSNSTEKKDQSSHLNQSEGVSSLKGLLHIGLPRKQSHNEDTTPTPSLLKKRQAMG